MPNPYPATFQDEPGRARLEGEIVFTDPANQPGYVPSIYALGRAVFVTVTVPGVTPNPIKT